jgi:hypothetical protein
MMLLKMAMAGAGLLALAACGGSGSGGQTNQSASRDGGDSGQAELAATLQPGEYEVTTQFVSLEGPNVPAEASAAMKGKTRTARNCITEKDLKDSKGSMFGEDDKQCSQNTISLAGGRLTGSLKCGSGNEATTLSVEGKYGAQSYEAEMAMQTAGGTSRIKMSGHRIGACPAGEAEEG